MSEVEESKPQESVQEALQQIIELLDKQQLVEELVRRQEGPRQDLVESLVHKQHLVELQKKLDSLHPADIAYVLEALPRAQRLRVWDMVKADRDGEILLEVSEPVRESIIAHMDPEELVAAAEQLDTDEIADLAPDLPEDVIEDVFKSLPVEEREQLRAAMSYPDDSVGALMDFDLVTVREDTTLEVVLRYLRRLNELPDHTDQLFVVDRGGVFKGALPINTLLVSDPEALVQRTMKADVLSLQATDQAQEAAQAFERYNLVTAPVTDPDGRLVGRVTVDNIVDFIRQRSEEERLKLGGLREEEDIFASVWASARNRWTWLAINLVTAFVASRVISIFEGTIEKLVALAALMPIVAGIGGNSGNQTITMLVRAIALGQINPASAKKLLMKEIIVAILNGLVWGGIIGVFATLLYHSISLGLVMTAAMTLNLLVAALFGVFIPMLMTKLGRDPAVGSSVMITAITDSGGFFIFLGLATLILLH
ncbi:MAG: magnesium transporter [Proteobacteria bacterium]|nr:MAG: magnesium transporter [Pseudomonadota bacterium]